MSPIDRCRDGRTVSDAIRPTSEGPGQETDGRVAAPGTNTIRPHRDAPVHHLTGRYLTR